MIVQGIFSQEFLDRIPDLEKEMIKHELDPEDFIIAKTKRTPNNYSMSNYYTVSVKGESFTVSMAGDILVLGDDTTSDMKFLEYFYGICFPPEENADTHPAQHKLSAVLHRLGKWLAQEPYTP